MPKEKIARQRNTGPNYWLIKAEPETRIEKGKDVKFSIYDLEKVQESEWDGVRNYEARNIMRDFMRKGDICLFYHSNCKTPGIAGVAQVSKESHVDDSAFDREHPYYDPKSSPDNPKWFCVSVRFSRVLSRFIPLKELQEYKDKELKSMYLLNRGRLSVQPVSKEEFDFIMELENKSHTQYFAWIHLSLQTVLQHQP